MFSSALEEARQSIVNRSKFVREAYGRVEAELDLVGATGIEDKLQEEVEETIAKLKVGVPVCPSSTPLFICLW